jgi:ferredoxin-NADP reductase
MDAQTDAQADGRTAGQAARFPAAAPLAPGDEHVRATARSEIAAGVVSLTLARPNGGRLPDWTPGSHIDLILPTGAVRQFSLCGDRWDPYTYEVAVLREPDGRGGSQYVHDELAVGDVIGFGGPRNNFPLVPSERYLFIAGGIGITPLLPMIVQADRLGADWELAYCGRSRASMAFADQLAGYGRRVRILAADTADPTDPADPGDTAGPGDTVDIAGTADPADIAGTADTAGTADRAGTAGRAHRENPAGPAPRRLNVAAELASHDPARKVYCCGPARLLADVEHTARAWPAGTLRTERFVARELGAPARDTPFEVYLLRSGKVVTVPPGLSVLEAVSAAGSRILSSCRQGLCGTCETAVAAGTPDHRDSILDDDERSGGDCMFVCVSRSLSDRLVLDL